MTTPAGTSTITFTADDGTRLVGDLVVPPSPRAAAIVCHPHPQYGGDRRNSVVQALFEALPATGIAALRFDFRATFDHGRGESSDARAALGALAAAVPDVPLLATGYSFGAAIVLGLDDERIAAKVLVAPPLAVMPVAPGMDVPTLVLTPAYDQYSPPERTAPVVAAWALTEHATIDASDHFLVGRTATAAADALAWLDRLLATS